MWMMFVINPITKTMVAEVRVAASGGAAGRREGKPGNNTRS